MLFYMCNIPKSALAIDALHNIVMERYRCYTSKAAEYDISTKFDVIGHFIMCLIACKSPLFHEIILKGETVLFMNKLSKLKGDEITKELNCVMRFLNSLNQMEGSSLMSSQLKQHKMLIKNICEVVVCKAKHVFGTNHRRTCYKYEIIVPFTFTLRLVAKREVDIVDGRSKVPCGLWCDLLIQTFELLLEFEIKFFKEFHFLQQKIYGSEDDRLRNVIDKVMKSIIGVTSLVSEAISENDIDKLLDCFPPCMSNLHKILRQTHRLSYYSRYQYTLFLKDIGLSAKENLSFWRNEYSKPHNGSSCTHDWKENVSRYEYQILHLYGLLGAKTLKTCHSCGKFTEKLSLRMDGGCPFVNFSNDALKDSYLKGFCEVDIEDILSEKAGNRPQRACALYCLQKKGALQTHGKQKITEILSPLHYYKIAKGS